MPSSLTPPPQASSFVDHIRGGTVLGSGNPLTEMQLQSLGIKKNTLNIRATARHDIWDGGRHWDPCDHRACSTSAKTFWTDFMMLRPNGPKNEENERRLSRRKINGPGRIAGENMPLPFFLIYYFQHPFWISSGAEAIS